MELQLHFAGCLVVVALLSAVAQPFKVALSTYKVAFSSVIYKDSTPKSRPFLRNT